MLTREQCNRLAEIYRFLIDLAEEKRNSLPQSLAAEGSEEVTSGLDKPAFFDSNSTTNIRTLQETGVEGDNAKE